MSRANNAWSAKTMEASFGAINHQSITLSRTDRSPLPYYPYHLLLQKGATLPKATYWPVTLALNLALIYFSITQSLWLNGLNTHQSLEFQGFNPYTRGMIFLCSYLKKKTQTEVESKRENRKVREISLSVSLVGKGGTFSFSSSLLHRCTPA